MCGRMACCNTTRAYHQTRIRQRERLEVRRGPAGARPDRDATSTTAGEPGQPGGRVVNVVFTVKTWPPGIALNVSSTVPVIDSSAEIVAVTRPLTLS